MSTYFPDPSRPVMMIRLSSDYDRKYWQKLLAQLEKNKAACDEVWFSTGGNILSVGEYAKQAAEYTEYAEDLRKAGIIPSLQIQVTLGHGDMFSRSCGYEELKWQTWVGVNGEKCHYVSCPRAPEFLEVLRASSELHAQWHPASVWIDDDLRPGNHEPAWEPYGCHCPDCIAAFSKQEGCEYTREELVEAYRADSELEKRWRKFATESLGGVAEVIAKAFLKISPETRFGLQHCHELHRMDVMEALQKVSGKRVSSRPGGGAYSDHVPYAIPDKSFLLQMQMFEQQGYDVIGAVCAEIESCPRGFCCKTSHGHRVESLLHLAMGMDSLSYFIMSPDIETPEWYGENLLEPLAKEAACYHEFAEYNADTVPSGIGLAGHLEYIEVRELGLPLIGVPVGGFSPASYGTLLNAPLVRSLSDEVLQKVLAGNLIIDGAAAAEICKRGFAGYFDGIIPEVHTELLSEVYTKDDLVKDLDSGVHVAFSFSGNRYSFGVPADCRARVLSRYKPVAGENDAAVVLLERADGTKVAMLGNDGFFLQFAASARVVLLNRIADWISGGNLPVMACEPLQCMIVPRVTKDNILRSVTVLNCVIGKQKPFTLELRNLSDSVESVEWCVPAEEKIKIPVVRKQNSAFVTIPEIDGWGIGWLKI